MEKITTYDLFASLMRERYSTDRLVGITPEEFRKQIYARLDVRDAAIEGFDDPDMQRDLSIRFHWGHDHDFGTFALQGLARDRHLRIPAAFVDGFGALPLDLTGREILDIGVWTGGTSLLLCALGGRVTAVEEVRKYAHTVEFLRRSFGIDGLTVLDKSLFDLSKEEFIGRFDYVLFSGVLYHVSDPILALRIVFNSLKDGGVCLVETDSVPMDGCWFRYDGPTVMGPGKKEDLSRRGWNWFIPTPAALKQSMLDVGFNQVGLGEVVNYRLLAVARKDKHRDMMRSGLSVRDIK